MDKQYILKILNNNVVKRQPLDIQRANTLFTEYCCSEHGKDINMTMKFIESLLSYGLLEEYLRDILDYYKVKFNITELKNINNNTILYF